MSVYRFIHAFASAPIYAGIPIELCEVSTLLPAPLAAGNFVDSVYFKCDETLVGVDAALSIGWFGSTDHLVPASAGVTAPGLTITNIAYNTIGTQLAPVSSVNLLLTSSEDITAGTVEVMIRCAQYLE